MQGDKKRKSESRDDDTSIADEEEIDEENSKDK